MKPRQAEVPTSDSPALDSGAITNKKPNRGQRDDDPVYLDVLVNDSRRHPTGARKTVRARLLHRYPMSVLVELPDGSVVKRRLGRDVPSFDVPHIGKRGVSGG